MPDIGHTIGDFQSLHHAYNNPFIYIYIYMVTVASFIMAYGSTSYVRMTLKKMAGTLKVHK